MSNPKSTDNKINKISQVLMGFAKENDFKYCYEEKEYSLKEVFSPSGFLVLFLADAQELYEKVFNQLYTHKELMEGLSGSEKRKSKRMSVEAYEKEAQYLSSQSINYRFPIVFVQKEKTYITCTPFVDPRRKVAIMTMCAFAVESVLSYSQQFKNDKSLLIDGMIPIEPLFEKVLENIHNKKVKILPMSMLSQFEKVEGVEVEPHHIPDVLPENSPNIDEGGNVQKIVDELEDKVNAMFG